MANRVTMNICGETYTLIAEESPSYMERVGNLVNEELTKVMEGTKASRTDAAILAAEMLALGDPQIAAKVANYKENLKNKITKANAELKEVHYKFKTN